MEPILTFRTLTEARAILPRWQRIFDVILTSIALVIALPIMTVTALAILATMGRPVLFKQRRPGLLGRDFEMIKFRTMSGSYKASDIASPDAARITKLGGWLRKCSIDELPELWLVLTGQMSLVGPRPLLPEYSEFYTSRELRRFLVRPGLTGLAQVSGRNVSSWSQRFDYDVYFVDNISWRLYWVILFRTIWAVVGARGVSIDAYAVAKPLHIERALTKNERIQS